MLGWVSWDSAIKPILLTPASSDERLCSTLTVYNRISFFVKSNLNEIKITRRNLG